MSLHLPQRRELPRALQLVSAQNPGRDIPAQVQRWGRSQVTVGQGCFCPSATGHSVKAVTFSLISPLTCHWVGVVLCRGTRMFCGLSSGAASSHSALSTCLLSCPSAPWASLRPLNSALPAFVPYPDELEASCL